jgi:hypothetical protein
MLPLFIRKFILDFVETGLAAVFLLTIAFPTSIDDAKKSFVVIGVATFGALVSALRRAVPDFLAWLKDKLAL